MANETMRLVQHYLCDSCNKEIPSPTNDKEWSGCVFQGDVCVADPLDDSYGGLIGGNFPTSDEHPAIEYQFAQRDVRKLVYCKSCIAKILGISKADVIWEATQRGMQ